MKIMRKSILAAVAAALTLSLLPVGPMPASAAQKIMYVQKVSLPSDWPTVSAMDWLNPYTGRSDFKLTSKCPVQRDCVTIRSGAVSGKAVGWTSATKVHTVQNFDGTRVTWSTTTITIDVAKAKRLGYVKADRRWLLAHELGHTLGLPHQATRVSFMYPYIPRPPMKTTAAERKHLATR